MQRLHAQPRFWKTGFGIAFGAVFPHAPMLCDSRVLLRSETLFCFFSSSFGMTPHPTRVRNQREGRYLFFAYVGRRFVASLPS